MPWRKAALAAYASSDPQDKLRLTALIPEPDYALAMSTDLPAQPGRPAAPQLVHASTVPRRKLGSVEGRIALIHAVAHIEFNAINLALDAALRFPGFPLDYYRDWIRVAKDEARHHGMLAQRLADLGASYGDCTAHNGLWEMAEKTAHGPLERMALVPRVLEARGLDVTPGMIQKLRNVNDLETVGCLEIILQEEVQHVAIGSRWFRFLCAQRELEPDSTFLSLLAMYLPNQKMFAGLLNRDARAQAGFSENELDSLSQ